AGVTVALDGKTATTDAAGVFLLTGVTAGTKRAMMIDGRTAHAPGRHYPMVVEPANLVAGQPNTSPYIFYLPVIDIQYEVNVVPNQDTIVTNPRVPGLKVKIPAGANLTNRDGSPVTRVSVTPVPPDRLPAPLPPGVKSRMVYTNQPGGAIPKEPIPVSFPNLGGEEPGTRLPLYHFNHDEVEWEIYGYGIVSKDGRTIEPETDPATGKPYGLPDLSWYTPGAGGTFNVCESGTCPNSRTPTGVDLPSG